MADVFISYKRRLRPRIVELAAALEQLKLSVWFDVEIEPGKSFGAVINRELADARCVLVCWTPDAFAPEHGDEISWVEAEATKGRERKILVPVLLEKTMLNAPWNMLQTENLVSWAPDAPPTGAWLGMLAGIGKFVQRPGLADYVRARGSGSAADLTRWAQAYPDDPLATDVWEHVTELEIAAAKARVEASRTSRQPSPAASSPRPTPAPPPTMAPPVPSTEWSAPAPLPDADDVRTVLPRAKSKPWRPLPLGLVIVGSLLFAFGVLTLFTQTGAFGYLSFLLGFILVGIGWLLKQGQY